MIAHGDLVFMENNEMPCHTQIHLMQPPLLLCASDLEFSDIPILNSLGVSRNRDGIKFALCLFGECAIVDQSSYPLPMLLRGIDDLVDGGDELGFVTSSGNVTQ
jgi:hypothetical protein